MVLAGTPLTTLALLRTLRLEIKHCEAAGGDWRSVIDGLRPQVQALWQALPLQEKRRFLRHLRPYWEVHRHRAAPPVMSALD
jgi:uncharacterized NAD(P)/FAD-binding protein YdhS